MILNRDSFGGRGWGRAGLVVAGWAAMIAAGAIAAVVQAGGQPDPMVPPPNRVGRADPALHAIVGATVHPTPDTTLYNATVVFRDGRIVSVEGSATPPAKVEGGDAKAPQPAAPGAPAGARVWDGTGLHVYAAFVEPYLEVDAPRPDPEKKGVHWNTRITPQRSALDGKVMDEATARALRNIGFGAAAVSPKGGIFRGTSAVVSLARPAAEAAARARPEVYRDRAYQTFAFELSTGDGGEGRWDSYPSSEMGAIALVRQTLLDADWQAERRTTGQERGALNALDALAKPASGAATPLLFDAADELQVLRGLKVAREFGRTAVVLGSGLEFRRLAAVAAEKAAVVVPLNFPDKPKANSVGEAEAIELRELLTWEQAPTNPRRLDGAGLTLSLTTHRLRDRGKFMENLRSAIRHGLPETRALAMLTTAPAALLGVEDQLGAVRAGLRANLLVTDGPVFAKATKVRDVWVDGVRHEVNAPPARPIEGVYALAFDPPPAEPAERTMLIEKGNAITLRKVAAPTPAAPAAAPAPAEPDAKAPPAGEQGAEKGPQKPKETNVKARNVTVVEGRLSLVFDHDAFGSPGVWTLSGLVEIDETKPGSVTIRGDGIRADGGKFRWTATRTGDVPKPAGPTGRAEKGDKGDKGDKRDKADKAEPEKDKAKPADDPLAGSWSLTGKAESLPPEGLAVNLTIRAAEGGGYSGSMTSAMGSSDMKDILFDKATGELRFTVEPGDGGAAHITGTVKADAFTGQAKHGEIVATLSGTRTGQPGKAGGGGDDDEAAPDVPEQLPGLPFGAYALTKEPEQPAYVLIVNATIWTAGPAGVIPEGEIVIKRGKIDYVGPKRSPRPEPPLDGIIIDAKGKHVTPGIIDCHSHTGISRGVNEGGQAVTAEVRIGDVTNPDAINWYRQLAGGVTAVNSLHGSANAIGGQNQVNKLRWGVTHPDQMHLEGATPGIKFALGENPKGGNSPERTTGSPRYPQTRMGVETLIRDRFIAAREYAKAWADYKAKRFVRPEAPPRRDLELEALAEILAGTRLVHCHSYRQDEILMLARVAEEFGFTIGTYQHILEGYKVAEAMRGRTIGASGFSDWWAYKVEVQDAIPQAFPIMHEQGLIVSYNSDSDELARRLNVEAGKAVKYSDGSVDEAEAIKWVTINPARQLKIDGVTGSLEKGKDADLVIWNGPPLSAFSKAEQTWIDGRCYFSLATDAALRERNTRERQRLMQKLLADRKPAAAPGAGGGDSARPAGPGGPGGPGGRPGGRGRPPQDGDDLALGADDASQPAARVRP
ncbi:MAG: amidohydrolase family protein, partial [Phycisphaeraceae bacterium]|nr:amidohydrolase family protein [Phycisphaeraceae bacterium]